MYNNFYNKSLISKRDSLNITPSIITREESEKRILERFPILKNDKIFHNYFSSYDFHDNEKDMVEFWLDVINFIFESIFQSFAVRISDILDSSKIKNRKPLGLLNIISDLINRGEYTLLTELKKEDYYKKNYPDLYKNESWGSYIRNGVVSIIKRGVYGLKSDYKHTIPKTDDWLINKKLFHLHLENIINILTRFLMEEDTDVLTIHELRNLLINSAQFQDTQLEICLHYLSKMKKIAVFKVKVDNTDMDCVKLLRDEESTVTEKDQAIINILVQLKKFDRKLEDIENITKECIDKAKEFLKKKNRDGALNCVKRKNVYLKAYQHYSNLKFTLEQNLLDIKSMESNFKVKNILEEVIKTSENLKMDVGDLEKVSDKLRDKKDNIKEAQDVLNVYNEEVENVKTYFNLFHLIRIYL